MTIKQYFDLILKVLTDLDYSSLDTYQQHYSELPNKREYSLEFPEKKSLPSYNLLCNKRKF